MPLFDTISSLFSVGSEVRQAAIKTAAVGSHDVKINAGASGVPVTFNFPEQPKPGKKYLISFDGTASPKVSPSPTKKPASPTPKKTVVAPKSPAKTNTSCTDCSKPRCRSKVRCSKPYKRRSCSPRKSPCMLRANSISRRMPACAGKSPCLANSCRRSCGSPCTQKQSPCKQLRKSPCLMRANQTRVVRSRSNARSVRRSVRCAENKMWNSLLKTRRVTPQRSRVVFI